MFSISFCLNRDTHTEVCVGLKFKKIIFMAFVSVVESIFRNHEDGHLPSSSSCAPQDFHGVSQFLMRRSMSFSGIDGPEELHPDEMSDDGSQMLGERKRRLNLQQVKALEKSFELGNKLEPERKVQLARALGLQPRQISIWFQNRRARWKTKQLEKDYDILKRQFEAIKSDNDALKSQNKKLQSQLLSLKSKESRNFSSAINLNKDNESCWSNGSDNSCDVNLNTTSADSKLYPHPNNKNAVVFPSSIGTSSRTYHFPNHNTNQLFCNMFGNIEENPEFWPWPDQQNFQ